MSAAAAPLVPGSLRALLRAHRTCRRCGRGYPIAPACVAAALDPIPDSACRRCAQRCAGGRCPSLGCRRGRLRIGTTRCVLGYHCGAARALVLAAKDRGSAPAATLLARLLVGWVADTPAVRDYDVLVPVPFHPATVRGRRWHPLTAIYLEALPYLRGRVPCDDLAPPFLAQTRPITAQRGRAEAARWRAVHGVFALGFRTRMLRGAHVLLLDDVMTSGATVSECARVLLDDGGAATVDACVFVRQPWRGRAGGVI